MLEDLKKEVFLANMELVKQNLVIYTWGNVSGIDREKKLIVIKPSGVSYDKMRVEDMVVVDLDGNVVEGKYRPSSDTLTHLALYKEFKSIGAVVHTHSNYAVVWAQAQRSIPCYGTTHADYFYGLVPCTDKLSDKQIKEDYEYNTGYSIVKKFQDLKINPNTMPAVLVCNHGPFTWGDTALKAVENSKVLEEVARCALQCENINPNIKDIDKELLDKHYLRKHGSSAYYGQ
ncbi:MAG: L-ribulose-5-phosphate 4-epimerase [Erysipelotrichaceae bacterium]